MSILNSISVIRSVPIEPLPTSSSDVIASCSTSVHHSNQVRKLNHWKVPPFKQQQQHKLTWRTGDMCYFSHSATEGTVFPCGAGGTGGGQFGALSPGLFDGGFLALAARPLGAGVGRVLEFAVPGAVAGGGGACCLGLEKWAVTWSFTWSFMLKFLFAVGWEEENKGIKGIRR